ncbi:MAG: hypothetical protein PHY47_19430 [Lachnospiraceae bacterium]|nr:hypothetical protein [Lachnospiraceae bacterium]
MKTKRAFYNSLAGLSYYFVTIFLTLFNQKILIDTLGIDYQGVNGLFSNVLSMLSIAELGIGTAIIYHLYRPLSEGDEETVIALMQFYRKCYCVIAFVILALGLLIMPFLGMIVTTNTTSYSLNIIYGFFLLDAVVSYLFTYKRSILIADQRNYVVIICDIFYQCGVKLGQVVILWVTHNFLLYLSLLVTGRVLENLLINHISNRRYPFLKNKNDFSLSKDILIDISKKVRGAVFHKIGAFVVLGTDNILISRFLGLTIVGIYSNYYLITNAIKSICSRVLSAATAGVGQLLVEKDEKKIYMVFSEMQILNGALLVCATTGIYCAITPAIVFVFGKKYVVEELTVFVLAFNFYIQGMRTVYNMFKETAGVMYEDRYVPIIESIINISASLVFLYYFGLAGVLLGTITSSLVLYAYTYPILVYSKILKRPISEYVKELLWITAVVLLSMLLSKQICVSCFYEKTLTQLLFNSSISIVVSVSSFVFLYAIWKKETGNLLIRIKKIFKNR